MVKSSFESAFTARSMINVIALESEYLVKLVLIFSVSFAQEKINRVTIK